MTDQCYFDPKQLCGHAPKCVRRNVDVRDEIHTLAFESPFLGQVVVCPEGRFIRCNMTFCNMLGYSEDELLSRHWSDVTHPDDILASQTFATSLLQETTRIPLTKRYLRKDTTPVRAEIFSNLVRNDEGEPLFFITYIQDIEYRYEYEQNLKQQAETYCAMVKGSMDGFWRVDPHEGTILEVNGAYCDLTGYSRAFLEGRATHELDHKASQKTCHRQLQYIIDRGQARYRTKHRRPDGALVPVEISAQYLPASLQIICFIRDITEELEDQAKLEALVERRTADLKASNVALESFAYAASHDLREPLNKVRAFATRLRDKYGEVLEGSGQEYLAILESAATRMAVLIDDLLMFSRTGREEAPQMRVNLNQVITEALADLEVSTEEAKAIVSVQPGLPVIMAHSMRLRQVFQNLLSNALKFRKPNEAAKVKIRGWVNGDVAIITVSDEGIGFNPSEGESIFTVFTRLHTRFEYPGTGVGLALCRRILAVYGGTIEALGESNAGATFTIRLPIGELDE